ncbi:MCE family protein [Marivirga sp. S37H4]|uniref:MCE family protein n=1 Tax=Marivirga aurantiaca TaxID=2802615 RepID=A0A934WXP7_9BACT|nr:MlaD family protein [Marivirga aurantiaca]MBK6264725.1 MCE family protein [Marivirga aurantiaca]
MKIAKEVKIAILAITSLVVFYLGFNYLKGVDFFNPTNEYYAIYEEINGLTESNPVLLSGLSVGRVSDIEILQDQENKVKVYFEVREDITLGKESEAILHTDLLGSQTIVLNRGNVTEVVSEDNQINGSVKQSLTSQIQEQAYPVLQTLDSVGKHLNGILANIDNNEQLINGILTDVKTTTDALANVSKKEATIRALIDDFKKISGTLADEKEGLSSILAKVNGIADSINALEVGRVVKRIDTTLTNVNAVIASMQDGEGTIDKLLNDDSLYNTLNKTLEDLDKLLIDVEQQPKKYVHFSLFGKKDKDKKD